MDAESAEVTPLQVLPPMVPAYADRAVGLQLHAPEGVDAEDGDQSLAGPLALAHLDQHVGAAGDDLSLGMLEAQSHGLFDGIGFIQCCKIVHGHTSSKSPASWNLAKRTWGVMGHWLTATPVAWKMALRMAGAPEQAGGSPRALVP